MILQIHPPEAGIVSGTISVPPSKSILNRWLVIRHLAGMPPLKLTQEPGSDNRVMAENLMLIRQKEGIGSLLDCKDGGTVIRFLAVVSAMTPGSWVLTGSKRLKERPMKGLIDSIREAGIQVECQEQENFAPFKISGEKKIKDSFQIDGRESSQFISAWLLAAPFMENGLRLTIKGNQSDLYWKMTLDMLQKLGVKTMVHQNELIVQSSKILDENFIPEPDWSATGFWYETIGLSNAGKISLPGFNESSIQGDAVVKEWLKPWVTTSFVDGQMELTKFNRKFEEPFPAFSLKQNPDLGPPLFAFFGGQNQPANFSAAKNLELKESNRITAMQTELLKAGIILHYHEPGQVSIKKQTRKISRPIIFETHQDHRIAMALAPLCLKTGGVELRDAEVVTKSYPAYFDNLENCGFRMIIV